MLLYFGLVSICSNVYLYNGGSSLSSLHPTDPLHISCICSIWKILHFYSSLSLNPSKSAFFHALTVSLLPKNHMLFIVSKQCACSRRIYNKQQQATETIISLGYILSHYNQKGVLISCNNVAPVTNLCLGRATTRSHSSQWSKKKVAVET